MRASQCACGHVFGASAGQYHVKKHVTMRDPCAQTEHEKQMVQRAPPSQTMLGYFKKTPRPADTPMDPVATAAVPPPPPPVAHSPPVSNPPAAGAAPASPVNTHATPIRGLPAGPAGCDAPEGETFPACPGYDPRIIPFVDKYPFSQHALLGNAALPWSASTDGMLRSDACTGVKDTSNAVLRASVFNSIGIGLSGCAFRTCQVA